MGHNVERAQELQQELAQQRVSLQQESAEVQALQWNEALQADIIGGDGSLNPGIGHVSTTFITGQRD